MSNDVDRGIELVPAALRRGVLWGLAAIVPISVLVELLERGVDNLEGSTWLLIPFAGILFAYAVAGTAAAQLAPDAPLTHGSLAALGAFCGWLAVRVLVPVVQGDTLGFGPRAVVSNALFASAFGVLGGAIAARRAPGWNTRDNGGGDESAGWPRTGPSGDPSEERPDSEGQGAG